MLNEKNGKRITSNLCQTKLSCFSCISDYFENSFLMKVTSRYITSNLVRTKLSCFSCILFKSYSNLVQTKLSCLSCIIDYLVKNEPVPVAALVNELLDCSRVGVTLEVPVHSDPDQVVTNSRTKI
jgi:hypothetical protein